MQAFIDIHGTSGRSRLRWGLMSWSLALQGAKVYFLHVSITVQRRMFGTDKRRWEVCPLIQRLRVGCSAHPMFRKMLWIHVADLTVVSIVTWNERVFLEK
eukprot:PhF_6_TR525/c0_g1_i1/m.342